MENSIFFFEGLPVQGWFTLFNEVSPNKGISIKIEVKTMSLSLLYYDFSVYFMKQKLLYVIRNGMRILETVKKNFQFVF